MPRTLPDGGPPRHLGSGLDDGWPAEARHPGHGRPSHRPPRAARHTDTFGEARRPGAQPAPGTGPDEGQQDPHPEVGRDQGCGQPPFGQPHAVAGRHPVEDRMPGRRRPGIWRGVRRRRAVPHARRERGRRPVPPCRGCATRPRAGPVRCGSAGAGRPRPVRSVPRLGRREQHQRRDPARRRRLVRGLIRRPIVRQYSRPAAWEGPAATGVTPPHAPAGLYPRAGAPGWSRTSSMDSSRHRLRRAWKAAAPWG